MNKIFFITLFLFLLFELYPFMSDYKWAPNNEQVVSIRTKLDGKWNRFFVNDKLKTGVTSRDLAGFILDALSVDYSKERIHRIILELKNMQDRLSSSRTYGNFFWYFGDVEIKDKNAVEFVIRDVILSWILFVDKIEKEDKELLLELLNISKIAIITQEVKISYTNIMLMKIWNLVALGEYLNDKSLANEGARLLREWILYTYKNGITEFLSPTYYAIDLENLALLYNFSKNSEVREIAKVALDYLWLEVAVNWYVPSERLGGTHSRCYDRLYGHGQLDDIVRRAGWLKKEQEDIVTPFYYYSFYQPNKELEKFLMAEKPRFVYTKWGEKNYNRYSYYASLNFSVGSAEANYYNMDKTPLVINIGSGYYTPVINFFMDERGDYYGFKKILEGSGHMKSLHLRPFITSVQNDGEVVFLSSIRNIFNNNQGKLESIITLPSDCEIWKDNVRLEVFNKKNKWQANPEPDNSDSFLNFKKDGEDTILELIDKTEKGRVGVSEIFNVGSGKNYRIKAMLKGGTIYLYLNFLDKNKRLLGVENIKKVDCNKYDFQEYEFVKTAPDKAEWCLAWVYSTTTNKTETLIKEIIFEEVIPRDDKSWNTVQILDKSDFLYPVDQTFLIKEGENIFIYRENVITAIRLIKAFDSKNKEINWMLYNDGLKYNALRLTATHSEPNTTKSGAIVVYSYTEEGINDSYSFLKFREKIITKVKHTFQRKNNLFDITVDGINGRLRILADVSSEKIILREGAKITDKDDFLLYVNGRDLGKEVLKECKVIQEYLKKR